MHFSFSTIDKCLQPTNSHNWINKSILKIKPQFSEDLLEQFRLGREGHKIVQAHVSGDNKDSRIDYIKDFFPIVERKDFDEECKFKILVDGYEIIGYFDGKFPAEKRFLEVKLSGGYKDKAPTPWSLGKFRDAMQRKIYALAEPTYTEAILITGSLIPDHWSKPMTKLLRRRVDLTEQDRKEATEYIRGAIAVFESGDFNGGLDPDTGRCTLGRMCGWGDACHFKNI